jgi:tetratricopeptide (TPR) repeat protein
MSRAWYYRAWACAADCQRHCCAIALAITLLSHAGCNIPGRGGPVSGELLSCRQLTQRGISAVDRGEFDKAEAYFNQAVQTCGVDCEARRQYAEALWRRGASAEAIAQLDEAIRLSSDDPLLLVRSGEMHLARGQIEPALAMANQAVDLDPGSPRGWVLRGRALQQAGDLRPALADYHRALGCEATNRDALLEVAELHRRLGQPQRALIALQTLAETYPFGEEPQHVFYLTGLAYGALGRHDEASENLQAAARVKPTPEILYRLAEAEWNAGRLIPARQAATQALAMEPQHAASQQLLSQLAVAEQNTRQR